MKKLSTFFKILNRKIEKYDKQINNPFMIPHPITIVWVEDDSIKIFDIQDEYN